MSPCTAFEAAITESAEATIRSMIEGDAAARAHIADACTALCVQLCPEDAETLSALPWNEAALCMSRIKGATRSMDGWFVARTHTPAVDSALEKLGATLAGPTTPATPPSTRHSSFDQPQGPQRLHLFLEMPDINCVARRRLEF
jgi:hypothetical protein